MLQPQNYEIDKFNIKIITAVFHKISNRNK